MKVFIVSYSDNDSGYVNSVWSTKALAETECEILEQELIKRNNGAHWASMGYQVEEYEIDPVHTLNIIALDGRELK